ncbi:MAG: hypothetical protein WC998_06185 [Candidatus Paceibacterota bacterium]
MLLLVIILIIVFMVIAAVVSAKNTKEGNEQYLAHLQSINFLVSKKTEFGDIALYVDDTNKKWAIKTRKNDDVKIFSYSDLTEFEVYEDGNSIAKGRAGSALVGGLLFGVVGAVVGGAGKKSISNTCKVLQLRIRVNNLYCPEIIVNFISTEIKKDSMMYRLDFEAAKNMAAILSYIHNSQTSAV